MLGVAALYLRQHDGRADPAGDREWLPWLERRLREQDQVAPLSWQHINLTGDDLWDADVTLSPDGFRSLCDSTPPLTGAA